MTDPLNGSSITNRFGMKGWEGYSSKPATFTNLQAFDNVEGRFKTFASGYSSTTAIVDSTGRNWYRWVINSPPPRNGGRYWPRMADGTSQARFKAVVDVDFDNPTGIDAYTFTDGEANCVVPRVIGGSGWAEAVNACGVTGREAAISAPCDAFVDNGCWDLPTFTELQDFPFDRSMEFSNGIQGVAHDDGNWFFTSAHRSTAINSTQLSRIAKIPVSRSLNEDISFWGNPYKPGFRHFGDLDQYDGVLYVPLEPGDGTEIYNAVGFFSTTDLSYWPAQPMPVNSPQRLPGKFPWIARNPKDGYFYSSYDNASEIFVYAVSLSGITYIKRMPLSKPLQAVQGGEFSSNGRLYITCDSAASGPVNIVDFSEPGRATVLGVANLHMAGDEELEGITLWDLDDGRAPGISGQIHVVLLEPNGISNDDWYFKHLRANPKFEL